MEKSLPLSSHLVSHILEKFQQSKIDGAKNTNISKTIHFTQKIHWTYKKENNICLNMVVVVFSGVAY